MEHIVRARILVLHLFEFAEEVDLGKLRALWADSTIGELVGRGHQPDAIRFRDPPVVLPLGHRPLTNEHAGTVRAKVHDFGIVSLVWTLPFSGTWAELVEESARLQADLSIESVARQLLGEITPRLEAAAKGPIGRSKLVEDYFITYVEAFDTPVRADDLLARKGDELARVLRGERGEMSRDERSDALRLHHSYRSDDLVIVTWNSAFVLDPEQSTDHLDIIEFANAQLLDLRYYDEMLEAELGAVYDGFSGTAGGSRRRRLARTSKKLMQLMIEIYDVQDKVRNAIKITGDVYLARIYRMTGESLRLGRWEEMVDAKLRIVQQVAQLLLEEMNQKRSVLLELMVIFLILIEVIMAFVGPGHR
ncbi:MAG: hypothetical protein VKP57_12285 [Candidatus Sericytochromatia bacterium]|nr:hypothetical protein [Candidatus Sericytochromatia bacterium]